MSDTHWSRTTWKDIQLLIRTARPDDAPILEDLFHNVNPEELRFRFLTSLSKVQPEEIRRMTHVDHQSAETYIAFTADTRLPVATAMLATDTEGKRGEVAISVRSDHRDLGIGRELLAFVAEQAEARGLDVIESIESRANRGALAVERDMAFTMIDIPGDPSAVLVRKELGARRTG